MSDVQNVQYISQVIARWRLIAVVAFLGTAAAGAYAFTATPWYEARLAVVPAEKGSDTNLLSKLPGIGPLGASAPTDTMRIRGVLLSWSVADEVIKKFDLQKRYGQNLMEDARATLWSHCTTSVDKKSSIVELFCEDTDPKLAMEMTAYFGEIGNDTFKRVSASSAREERKFLEGQVAKAKEEVDVASEALRKFQVEHKLVDLPEQAKAVISAMANVKGELLSKELELSYLTKFASRTESTAVQLQERINGLKAQLAALEQSSPTVVNGSAGSAAGSADFFPEAMGVPDLRYQLEQLMRDQKIKETLYFLMSQRYETARADEARDTSTFQILDYPSLPTKKSRPKRLRILIGGFAWGFVLATGFVLADAWRRRRRVS